MINIPYIPEKSRPQYEQCIQKVVTELQANKELELEYLLELSRLIHSVGDANYVISSIIWRLFDAKPSYTFGNGLISVVEDVKSYLANEYTRTDQANEPFYLFLNLLCRKISSNVPCVRGMLACVVLEFYRRRLAEYENLQLKKSGDIL